MAKKKNRIKVKQYRARDLKKPMADFIGKQKKEVADYNKMTKRQRNSFDKRLLMEQAALVESMRQEIIRREGRFQVRGLYSHGLEALKEKMSVTGFDLHNPIFTERGQKLGPDVANRGNKRMALIQVYSMMRNFLDPTTTQTNSVGGIQRVNAEQDRLIFGVNERGRPAGTLGSKFGEREKFWALVDAIRASDVVRTADLYFFKSDGFIKLWKNAKFRAMDVDDMAKEVQKFFDQRYQSYPPTTDTATKEGEESGNDAVGYLKNEISAMFERRGIS